MSVAQLRREVEEIRRVLKPEQFVVQVWIQEAPDVDQWRGKFREDEPEGVYTMAEIETGNEALKRQGFDVWSISVGLLNIGTTRADLR